MSPLISKDEGRRPSDISKTEGGERKRKGKGRREEEKREEGITVSR
jgi:hypothetical protein